MGFIPERVYVREKALEYTRGREAAARFREMGVPVTVLKIRQRIPGMSVDSVRRGYIQAKKILILEAVNTNSFISSRPSADYQLPLSSGCIGFCEYCYLNTTLGKRPYLKVYVNLEEILNRATAYIGEFPDRVVTFEGSCTSDPIPLEPYLGSLATAIEFFGRQPRGRFRFVTKYTDVASLLDLPHHGHTRFRFSINTDEVILRFEHGTPTLIPRLDAARRVIAAGYPSGFIVAPLILEQGWMEQYGHLFLTVREILGNLAGKDFTFELITHRYTDRARQTITDVFPKTKLPMDAAHRIYRRGQFGYGKYLYPKELMSEAKERFGEMVRISFPEAQVDYFI
ncbi:MAG: spore photoproduct lyase [Desulforudis sp.]|nr:MAG: spore photoproduct lyase [Desulforudis sp.]